MFSQNLSLFWPGLEIGFVQFPSQNPCEKLKTSLSARHVWESCLCRKRNHLDGRWESSKTFSSNIFWKFLPFTFLKKSLSDWGSRRFHPLVDMICSVWRRVSSSAAVSTTVRAQGPLICKTISLFFHQIYDETTNNPAKKNNTYLCWRIVMTMF